MNQPDHLLRLPEVLQIVQAGKSSIYSWMALGIFPCPVRIGPRAVRWRRTQIERYIQEREEANAVPF